MADYEEMTPKDAYIQGRLLGLNELIKILKDAVEGGGDTCSSALVKSVVMHISNEMDSIIDDLKARHGESHPALQQAVQKSVQMKQQVQQLDEEEPAAQDVRKQVQAADDLMKNLLSFKGKPARPEGPVDA